MGQRFKMIVDNNKKLDYFFSELHHFQVIDKNKRIIGSCTEEALLSLEDFSLDSLIVVKSFFKKLVRTIIDKETNKVIIPVSNLKAIDPVNRLFLLSVATEELKQIDSNFSTPPETIKYSNLMKYPVYSKDEIKLGRIIDIHYYQDTCKFVIAKTRLENIVSRIVYFTSSKQFIVPEDLIEQMLDKIRINVTKKELVTFYAQSYLKPLKPAKKSYVKAGGEPIITNDLYNNIHFDILAPWLRPEKKEKYDSDKQ